MQRRPYQIDCISAVKDAIERGVPDIMFTQPTGCGKTFTSTALLHDLRDMGLTPALFLAHREELLEQAAATMLRYDKTLSIGIEQANRKAHRSADVIVASVQTLVNSKRLAGWTPRVIFTDECHHSCAASYKKVVARMRAGGAIHIGMTATAKRGDKQGLVRDGSKGMENAPFAEMVYQYSILQAIKDGYLCTIRGFIVRTQTDLSNIKNVAGDYNQGELDEAVDTDDRTLFAIDNWEQVARDRRTIAFCTTVKHARGVARKWRERGYTAEVVSGEMPTEERRAVIHRFKTGVTQVLTNVNVLTEGFDDPPTSCIVCLRPTQIWGVYVQQVGRGLRLADGKTDCIVLDVVDISRGKNPATLPQILDLPPTLDLQGHTLEEANDLMKQFRERLPRLAQETPTNYLHLKGILEAVDLLDTASVQARRKWDVLPDGSFQCVLDAECYAILRRGSKLWELTLRNKRTGAHKEVGVWKASEEASALCLRRADPHIDFFLLHHRCTDANAVTEKQRALLRKHDVSEAEIATMNKFSASTRIGIILTAKQQGYAHA